MKKITVFILAYFISSQLFSQPSTTLSDSVMIDKYLLQSKKQKTAGNILCATGLTLYCVTTVLAIVDMSHSNYNIFSNIYGPVEPEYKDHSDLNIILLVT